MSELNYEAIGRCKVLGERIKQIHTERMKAIAELRAAIHTLHQKGDINKIPPEIVEFNPRTLAVLAEEIGRHDSDLMRVVNEYNNWCSDAGEKPVKLINPD